MSVKSCGFGALVSSNEYVSVLKCLFYDFYAGPNIFYFLRTAKGGIKVVVAEDIVNISGKSKEMEGAEGWNTSLGWQMRSSFPSILIRLGYLEVTSSAELFAMSRQKKNVEGMSCSIFTIAFEWLGCLSRVDFSPILGIMLDITNRCLCQRQQCNEE